MKLLASSENAGSFGMKSASGIGCLGTFKGRAMAALGTAVIGLLLGCLFVWRSSTRERARRDRPAVLEPGSLVLVRTPDHKQLVATVLSRGPSHFWIELMPGDARWWVPATAVEPAPDDGTAELVSSDDTMIRRTLRREPRPVLDSEI